MKTENVKYPHNIPLEKLNEEQSIALITAIDFMMATALLKAVEAIEDIDPSERTKDQDLALWKANMSFITHDIILSHIHDERIIGNLRMRKGSNGRDRKLRPCESLSLFAQKRFDGLDSTDKRQVSKVINSLMADLHEKGSDE